MGLFDFLKPRQTVTPGAMTMGSANGGSTGGSWLHNPSAPEGMQDYRTAERFTPGDMQAPPTLGGQQSFLDRLKAPDENGISFGDRLYAMSAAGLGNGQEGMALLNQRRADARGLQKETRDSASRARASGAFRAAMESGKFDPSVWAERMGDNFDVGDVANLTQQYAPKPQVLQGARSQVSLYDPVSQSLRELRPGDKERPSGGYIWDEDSGTYRYAPGGPHDPRVIAEETGARRRTMQRFPMPQRGSTRLPGVVGIDGLAE